MSEHLPPNTSSVAAPPRQGEPIDPHGPDDQMVYVSPRMTALQILRRHWLIALVSVVAGLAIGAAFGLARKPNYAAETRLAVGGVNLAAPGALSGFALATQSLAATYSRGVGADDVVVRVAREVGVPVATVRQALTASPIPESPVVRVVATTKNATLSRGIANSASAGLRDYVVKLNEAAGTDRTRLRRVYTKAAAALETAAVERDDAAAAYRQSANKTHREALIAARADVETAQLRLDALRQNYQTATAAQTAPATLQPLTSANVATSDRRNKLEIALFIGLVAGAAVGLALASMRASRLRRRQGA